MKHRRLMVNISQHQNKDVVKMLQAHDEYREYRFPSIQPEWDTKKVGEIAYAFLKRVEVHAENTGCDDISVIIDGDNTFVYAFVSMAKDIYIDCYMPIYNSDGALTKLRAY